MVYMLIGLPGSGKSTYANKLKTDNNVIISSDGIREEIGYLGDMSRNKEVFGILKARLKENVENNKDVILDCTNLTCKGRKSLLEDIEDKKVAIVLDKPISTCIENNNNRERNIKESIINSMSERFDKPTYEEGFDAIITYKSQV